MLCRFWDSCCGILLLVGIWFFWVLNLYHFHCLLFTSMNCLGVLWAVLIELCYSSVLDMLLLFVIFYFINCLRFFNLLVFYYFIIFFLLPFVLFYLLPLLYWFLDPISQLLAHLLHKPIIHFLPYLNIITPTIHHTLLTTHLLTHLLINKYLQFISNSNARKYCIQDMTQYFDDVDLLWTFCFEYHCF